MNLADASKVELLTRELDDVLKGYSKSEDSSIEKKVTVSSGRTYKVANVIEKKDGTFIVSDLVSRGMFVCDYCEKDYNGDCFLQFTRGEKAVILHSSLIHLFKKHPEQITSEELEEPAQVFLN